MTLNFYSILFYNAEIWLIGSPKERLKTKLLSASAKALKMCIKFCFPFISFETLHAMINRATPNKMLLYKQAIELYKLYNAKNNSWEWID